MEKDLKKKEMELIIKLVVKHELLIKIESFLTTLVYSIISNNGKLRF